MVSLSILSNLPETGDLLLLVISALLTVIAVFSKQHVNKMEQMMKQNTADHSHIEKKLANVDTWTKSVHEMEIAPTVQRSKKNEENILKISYVQKDHSKRLGYIEEKIAK